MFASSLIKAPAPVKSLVEKALPTHVVVIYFVFAIGAYSVYHHIAEQEFSAILTMGVIVQTLATVFMCMQVLTSGRATGISATGLMLDAIAVALRLSSTVWLNGYLPTDRTGDHVYQIADFCTLGMLLFLFPPNPPGFMPLPELPPPYGLLGGTLLFTAEAGAPPPAAPRGPRASAVPASPPMI